MRIIKLDRAEIMTINLNEKEKTEEKEDLEIFHSIMEDVVGEFFIEPEEDSLEEDAFCFFEF